MNTRATFILGPAEMAGLLREFPDSLWSSDCIALTPDAYEYSKTDSRLQNIFYPSWVQAIRTFSIEDYRKVELQLMLLEDDSSKMRGHMFLGDTNKVDWNYQSNFSIASMLLSSRNFANQAFVNLMRYEEVEIIALGHAGEFYFDSCIQPAVLCHELKRLGIKASLILLDERAKASTYQPQLYESLPNLFSEKFIQGWSSVKKSVIVATSAIYSKDDQKKLALVLNGAYPDAQPFIYPLPLWPVINASDLFYDRCSTLQAIGYLLDEARSKCLIYSEWLTSTTESFLINIFEDPTLQANHFFRAQIKRLHKRHLLQTLTYTGWKIALGVHKPQMLALTIQDSSINGPLASAAKFYGVDIVVFPHSHVVNWRTPCDCTVVTEWWQPMPSKTLWGNHNQCLYFDTPVFLHEKTSLSNRRPNWMVLYNGVQENLANSVAWPFIQQVVSLIEYQAKETKANVTHRLKPGDQTPVQTFCELLGLEKSVVEDSLKAPLHDLLINTDLVVSVDDPSSALWEALSLGCVVILVTDRILTNESLADGDILSPICLGTFTNLLISFAQNPNSFNEYRLQQQVKLSRLRTSRIEI